MKAYKGYKVCSAKECARVEALFQKKGLKEEDLVKQAGHEVALLAMHFIKEHSLSSHITILAGKGNNASDAYSAGEVLVKNHFSVTVFSLFSQEEISSTCSLFLDRFQKKGGKVLFPQTEKDIVFPPRSLIIDGIFGTGFQGKLEGLPLAAVKQVRSSQLPVISIDIPSGVSGDTGEVFTDAISATQTIFFTLPKAGFFLEKGWNYVGQIVGASVGYPHEFMEEIREDFFLADRNNLKELLPFICRTRHKYEAGYVLGIGGKMEGALALSGLSALRSGCGLVRLFSSCAGQKGPLELIWDSLDLSTICEEMTRAKALFMGPGMGRDKQKKELFFAVMEKRSIPTVIDADGLFFLSEKDIDISKDVILTPHRGEMLRLLSLSKMPKEKEFISLCQKYVDKKGCVLLVKGAVNFLFQKGQKPFLIPGGDPGMATAGSGDVLTGIISSFLAQGLSSFEAALLGASIHAISGEMAAKKKGSFSLIASDLIEAFPEVFLWIESQQV